MLTPTGEMADQEYPKVETLEQAKQLIDENPDVPYYYQQLGKLQLQAGDLMAAWQAYMDALEVDPDDPFTCLYFGNLMALCYDKRYALQLYRHAVEKAPLLPAVHWCLGDLYRDLGEFEAADSAYRRAVEVDEHDAQARQKLEEWTRFREEIERNDSMDE